MACICVRPSGGAGVHGVLYESQKESLVCEHKRRGRCFPVVQFEATRSLLTDQPVMKEASACDSRAEEPVIRFAWAKDLDTEIAQAKDVVANIA